MDEAPSAPLDGFGWCCIPVPPSESYAHIVYEFCTLFDSAYLPRAVVLARSLAATCPSFCLRAFCMDEKAHELLDALALPGVVSIGPGELEAADPELRSVKARRTRAEYCWTATPAVCLQSLEREPVLEAITYLDADLMFFADPHAIFDELGRGSILLTAHRHTRRRGQGAPPEGIFNVQFITFRRDEHGLAALRWWRERCLERCELAPEEGVWGDQKYLDDWPERFGGVHVLEHPGALGPWNVASHALEQQGESVLTDGVRLVFFHFTAFDLYRGLASLRRLGLLKRQLQLAREPIPLVWASGHPIADRELDLLWAPYFCRLGEAIVDVRALDPSFDAGIHTVGLLDAVRRARGRRARSEP